MYTEEVNKIALSSKDDKRLQTLDGVTTYPHGTNVFKVCESEIMIVSEFFFFRKLRRLYIFDEIILQQQM